MGDEHDKYVVFDFDGVCCSYKDGWQGEEVFGEPVKGAAEFVDELNDKGYKTLLFTVRKANDALNKWLEDNSFHFSAINSTSHNPVESGKEKPAAELYIDDKAARFDEDKPEDSFDQIRKYLDINESVFIQRRELNV